MKTGGNFASVGPNDKKQSYADDINNGFFLKNEGVRILKKNKHQGNGKETLVNQVGNVETNKKKKDCGKYGTFFGDIAPGQRPKSFDRMETILVDVIEVVDKIGRRREKAKRNKGKKAFGKNQRVENLAV